MWRTTRGNRGRAYVCRLSATGSGPAHDRDHDSCSSPDVTFHCATETLVLLLSARLTLESALDSGRVIVEGDRRLAMAFSQWFKSL
jgi:SCP-2 sterol transfer family protein